MIYSSSNEIAALCDVTSSIVVRKINVCFRLFIARRIVYFVKNCIIYLVFRMFIDISTLVKLIYHCLFFMNIMVSNYLFHLYIGFFFNEIQIIFHNPYLFVNIFCQFIVLFIIYIQVDTLESFDDDKLFPLLN